MKEFSGKPATALWLLAAGLVLLAVPATAQSGFAEQEFCQELKRVVAILDKKGSSLKELKGKQISKTEWAARKNVPGMNDCKIVDEDRGKDLQSFLESRTGYACELTVPARKVDASTFPSVAELRKARQEAALETRARADKLLEQFDRAIVACLPDMKRSFSDIVSFPGTPPALVYEKTKGNFPTRVRLEMLRMPGFPLKIGLRVDW